MKLAGVDGCRAGWIIASSDRDLARIAYAIVAADAIGQVFEAIAADDGVVAIDIPIGLAENAPRACDLAARRYLAAPRASSVFPAPCRATLVAASYGEACDLNRLACGRGVSLQTFGILHKIRYVDEALTPELQHRVREAHPEVVFARLSGECRGLAAPKKSVHGQAVRRTLLETRVPSIDTVSVRAELGRSRLSIDDLLDALACLVAAHDIATGEAMVLPHDRVERDRRGLRMEIVA